jgi:hypothetical protein
VIKESCPIEVLNCSHFLLDFEVVLHLFRRILAPLDSINWSPSFFLSTIHSLLSTFLSVNFKSLWVNDCIVRRRLVIMFLLFFDYDWECYVDQRGTVGQWKLRTLCLINWKLLTAIELQHKWSFSCVRWFFYFYHLCWVVIHILSSVPQKWKAKPLHLLSMGDLSQFHSATILCN